LPGSGQTGERLVEFAEQRAVRLIRNGPSHCDLPEDEIQKRSQHFSDHRFAERVQQIKWLELRKDRWGKERKARNISRESTSVMNCDRSARVVSNHVPPLHTVLETNRLNLLSESIEMAGAVWDEWCLSHARKIDGKASMMVGKPAYDAIPQLAVGRHAMDEKDCVALTLVSAMHGDAPLYQQRICAVCLIRNQRGG
jgi:hypothetical protein